MANMWWTIPKLVEVDRGEGDVPAIRIERGWSGTSTKDAIGMDGGLTLKEGEELAWRLKQGIHLLKHGKLPNQHA